jgi:hypothetical protein
VQAVAEPIDCSNMLGICNSVLRSGWSKCRHMRQLPAGMQPLAAFIRSKTDDALALKPLHAMLDAWAFVADRKGESPHGIYADGFSLCIRG